MPGSSESATSKRRIAYLSLQAVVEGEDAWAAVREVIDGMHAAGCGVDLWTVSYRSGRRAGALERLAKMLRVQLRLIRRLGDYDALYCRTNPLSVISATVARLRGVAVVQECNGSYEDLFVAWPVTRRAKPIFRALGRSQYRRADAVITVTPQLADWVRRETGRPDCDVSPNGVNTSIFSPAVERRAGLPPCYAVFFGQFAPWQGIGVILAALRSEPWPAGLDLVFVGDGALRPDVEAAAADDPRVVYLGRLPYRDVAGVVTGAVASLVPAFDPARAVTGLSPLKVYETMACRVPVIVSDTAGQAELIREEHCGLVVPAGDAEALARALQSILANPDEAAAMAERGRAAAVERHSWGARARDRLAVVDRAIESVRARRSR